MLEDAWRASKAAGNNFDALRLAAAFAVIVSHSFEIVGGAPAQEPLRVLTAGDSSLGRIAVMTFFVLSGFLLTRSYGADPTFVSFVRKRALRIAPALIAVVAASVFFLGPAMSEFSPAAYFGNPVTWKYFANLTFYTGFDELPGVFSATPVPGVVNGPLWTLKFEVMCYLTLSLAGAAGALRPRAVLIFVFIMYFAGATFGDGPESGWRYYAEKYVDLARPFFVGAFFALHASRTVLSARSALVCIAGLFLAAPLGVFSDAFPIFGGYLVLWFGFAPLGPLARAGRFGDFSYGFYLWGWPAQQFVAQVFATSDWLHNVALATPLALVLAVLSWTLVEKPALALKEQRSRIKLSKAGVGRAKAFAGSTGSRYQVMKSRDFRRRRQE